VLQEAAFALWGSFSWAEQLPIEECSVPSCAAVQRYGALYCIIVLVDYSRIVVFFALIGTEEWDRLGKYEIVTVDLNT
jgi:hypothetical protein